MASFVQWLSVQRRVAVELLPSSWGARQVGKSLSWPTWRPCRGIAHRAVESWGLSHPWCSQLCCYFSGSFSGPGSGLFWFLIIFEAVEELKPIFYYYYYYHYYCRLTKITPQTIHKRAVYSGKKKQLRKEKATNHHSSVRMHSSGLAPGTRESPSPRSYLKVSTGS